MTSARPVFFNFGSRKHPDEFTTTAKRARSCVSHNKSKRDMTAPYLIYSAIPTYATHLTTVVSGCLSVCFYIPGFTGFAFTFFSSFTSLLGWSEREREREREKDSARVFLPAYLCARSRARARNYRDDDDHDSQAWVAFFFFWTGLGFVCFVFLGGWG